MKNNEELDTIQDLARLVMVKFDALDRRLDKQDADIEALAQSTAAGFAEQGAKLDQQLEAGTQVSETMALHEERLGRVEQTVRSARR